MNASDHKGAPSHPKCDVHFFCIKNTNFNEFGQANVCHATSNFGTMIQTFFYIILSFYPFLSALSLRTPEALSLCHGLRVPQRRGQCLNVAATGAICLYELCKASRFTKFTTQSGGLTVASSVNGEWRFQN